MKYAVDRIEKDIVVLENIESKEIVNVDLIKLPSNVCEGDILSFDGKVYLIDREAKKERLNKIRAMMDKLKERDDSK